MCLHHFVEKYEPTVEDSYTKQVLIDQQSCVLQILDTAGAKEYEGLQSQWIRDSSAFLLVYNVASRSSFTAVRKLYAQIQRTTDSINSESLNGRSYHIVERPSAVSVGPIPVILVGNKNDVHGREVWPEEGRMLAKELECGFVETSAKTRSNVEGAFYDLVRVLRSYCICQELPRPLDRTATCDDALGSDTVSSFSDSDAVKKCWIMTRLPRMFGSWTRASWSWKS